MTHYNQEDLLKAIRSIHWLRVINSASDQVDMFRLTVIKSSQYLGLINDATWCVQIENDQSKTRDQRWATIGKTTFKSRVIKSRWKLKRNQSCVSIWETISGWERIKSIYYTRIINDPPPPNRLRANKSNILLLNDHWCVSEWQTVSRWGRSK